ncbi:MAG: hypothetical protein LJE67_07725 [Salaquimonas sp.]|nr:hypothetical protein [Salaquimonas sp.]
MSLHQFGVGQTVRLKRGARLPPKTPEFYKITRLLPPTENMPQYRIRSDAENHDRVVTQDSIEAVGGLL